MPYKELTYKHLTRLSNRIKDKIPVNTGGAASSLEVKDNKLLGNDYIYYLDQGRAGGKYPPVQSIRDWVRQKMGITDEQENKQVAFLIGRKIANEGTEIFNDKTKGIQLELLVEQMLNELIKELPNKVAAEALTFIDKEL